MTCANFSKCAFCLTMKSNQYMHTNCSRDLFLIWKNVGVWLSISHLIFFPLFMTMRLCEQCGRYVLNLKKWWESESWLLIWFLTHSLALLASLVYVPTTKKSQRCTVLSRRNTFFFCEGSDNITLPPLQPDPEKKRKYKEVLLLLDPDEGDAQEPPGTRRCRCSASRLG